jgi:hypothetical protein
MIRSIYTEKAYFGFYAFVRGNDRDEDSPHGWGMTEADARESLADVLNIEPCTDCDFGPCDMNCGAPA